MQEGFFEAAGFGTSEQGEVEDVADAARFEAEDHLCQVAAQDLGLVVGFEAEVGCLGVESVACSRRFATSSAFALIRGALGDGFRKQSVQAELGRELFPLVLATVDDKAHTRHRH